MRLTSTIIICTKDREADLARCLDSLSSQARTPDELVVVDAGTMPADGQVRRFSEAGQACRVQHIRSEPGLTRQRNLGIRAATGDVVHFLDDDVILDAAYLEEIQATFETTDAHDLVAVSPMLRTPQGPPSAIETALRKLFLLVRLDGTGRMQPSGFGTLTWYTGHTDLHPLELACGCCAYRRSVFDQIEFDEHFAGYGYMEDQDFSYRAGKLGRLVGNPRATMLHVHTSSSRMDWRSLTEMQIVNHHYVFKKHLRPGALKWACFWWSEVGESLIRLMRCVKISEPGILIGSLKGYAAILQKPRG